MEGQNTAKATGKEEVCKSKDKQQAVNGFGGSDQGNSIYFPEITICSTLGLKAAI